LRNVGAAGKARFRIVKDQIVVRHVGQERDDGRLQIRVHVGVGIEDPKEILRALGAHTRPTDGAK
jgi:hypothetical protein